MDEQEIQNVSIMHTTYLKDVKEKKSLKGMVKEYGSVN